MKRGRKAAILLLVGLMLTAMAGCGGGSSNTGDSASKPQGKVTLQYYTWNDEADYMKKVVEAFNNQNSDIEVKLNMVTSKDDEYNTQIMNNLSGGSQMDIYSLNGTAMLGTFASKKQLVDLTDRVKAANLDVGAYGPSYQDITRVLTEGKYYALPYRTSEYALFYNKDLFDKAGVKYPTQMTWEKYAQLAKQLTKGDGTSKQWGGYYADWMIAPLGALQKGATILDDDLTEVSNFLEYLDRLYYKDQSHMSYKQMKAESVDWIKQFEGGNVAMLVNGEWTINMLKADIAAGKAKMNFDMAPLPLPDGVSEPTTVGGVSTFVGINPNSKNIDAAFKFVEFLGGEKGESIIAESSVLPAYSSDATKASFLKATGIQGSNFFFDAKTVVENQPIAQIDEVNKAFKEQRDLYLFQQQPLDKTIKEFENQRKSILGK
ncbi:ABC transporter substrate-binding protein [Paenibacillus puldeungensis]|uniref:ABC transporter substrate-binding protein n=1 Tax=Paenibacillus puldeungensis TaxID=696536 RepID=A0ABW3S0G1_9BACL